MPTTEDILRKIRNTLLTRTKVYSQEEIAEYASANGYNERTNQDGKTEWARPAERPQNLGGRRKAPPTERYETWLVWNPQARRRRRKGQAAAAGAVNSGPDDPCSRERVTDTVPNQENTDADVTGST